MLFPFESLIHTKRISVCTIFNASVLLRVDFFGETQHYLITKLDASDSVYSLGNNSASGGGGIV